MYLYNWSDNRQKISVVFKNCSTLEKTHVGQFLGSRSKNKLFFHSRTFSWTILNIFKGLEWVEFSSFFFLWGGGGGGGGKKNNEIY